MMMNFPAAALILSYLVGSAPPPTTCLSGTIAPRVSKADLANAQEIVGVTVETVERLPYSRCRTVMLVGSVERSPRIQVGQRFVVETRCADANTLMEHPDEWIYSDVPVVGEGGRFYAPRHDVVPPGAYYLAVGNEASLADTRIAQAGTPASRCAG